MDRLRMPGREAANLLGAIGGRVGLMLVLMFPALPARVHAAELFSGNEVLQYAVGYRVAAPRLQNVVELGTLYRCKTGYCVDRQVFEGRLNLPVSNLPYKHQLKAPYRSPKCQDGPIRIVRGDFSHSLANMVSLLDERRLQVRVAGLQYDWERDGDAASGYRLVDIARDQGAEPLDQVVGFAFAGQRLSGVLMPEQLMPRYAGEMFHKDMRMTPSDDWRAQSSSLLAERFRKVSGAPVLTLSNLGKPEVSERAKRDIWVGNDLVLAPESEGGALVQEYGHDFNANGCFDERGHNKQILPVLRDGKVMAMVYVEYTPDIRDGVPMISVGRYYESKGRSTESE